MTVDTNAVRGKWTIGRITKVHPGPDGKVRNVTLKTPTGDFRIVGLHRKNCSDFGSGEYFTRICGSY
jgi:hypothetical protein